MIDLSQVDFTCRQMTSGSPWLSITSQMAIILWGLERPPILHKASVLLKENRCMDHRVTTAQILTSDEGRASYRMFHESRLRDIP